MKISSGGNADVELSDPLQVIELQFIFPMLSFQGWRIRHPDLGPWAGAPRMQVPGRLPPSLSAEMTKQLRAEKRKGLFKSGTVVCNGGTSEVHAQQRSRNKETPG